MYGKFIDMIWCDCCCKFAVSLQIFHTPAIRKQLIGTIIGVQNLCALKKNTIKTYQNQSNISFHELQKTGKTNVPALSTSRPASRPALLSDVSPLPSRKEQTARQKPANLRSWSFTTWVIKCPHVSHHPTMIGI